MRRTTGATRQPVTIDLEDVKSWIANSDSLPSGAKVYKLVAYSATHFFVRRKDDDGTRMVAKLPKVSTKALPCQRAAEAWKARRPFEVRAARSTHHQSPSSTVIES